MSRAVAVLVAALVPASQAADLPQDLDGWIRRQNQMLLRGEPEKAEAEARARVERQPKDAEALYLLGRILANSGKLDEALVQYQAALDFDDKFALAWSGMALVHDRRGEFDRALEEATRAHAYGPTIETRALRVRVLYNRGERPAAQAFLREELENFPDDPDLRCLLAYCRFKDGLPLDAEKEARQVLAHEPRHLRARYLLVQVLRETGRADEAVRTLREAARLFPKQPFIRSDLLDLLIQQEDFEAAAAVVEELLTLDPPPPEREELLRSLRRLRKAAAAGKPAKPPTMPELTKQVDSTEVEERREALRILLGMDVAPQAAFLRFSDEDETVRLYAMKLFAKYAEPDMAELLDYALFNPAKKEPSAAVRAAAVDALGRTRTHGALPSLILALYDKDPETVRAALAGIAAIAGKSFVLDVEAPLAEADLPALREKCLRWWLTEPSGKHWRRKAAAAIGREKHRGIAWYVVPWILEDDAATRTAVLDCMARLTGDEAWRDADSSTPESREALKQRAFEALGEKR